ncbi:hypothetical protein [Leptolyngbya ohadii]|uniref:hypothetical protein n=1 Tax=Leptolyngbya ohadii TaxID=1962290 RepID=UPI000B59B360|nr:hypothetical protein [Leptolyngbya ohadii]
MNHRILECGAIACSTVVIAQWLPAFNVQLPSSNCSKEPEPEPASAAADRATVSPKCSSSGILSLMERLPEQFKLQWSQTNSRLPGNIEREYQQLIEQAQTLAGQNRLAEAIVLMNSIPKNSRYFDMAYEMQETWSQEALHEASSRYQQAEISAALKLLEAIPATSSQYPQVVQFKQKWQQDAVRMQQAIAASKTGNWQQVIEQLEALQGKSLFQSLRVQELLQLAMIKVLEPEPELLKIASQMNSTSLSAAPLPSPPAVPAASVSSSVPPLPPPTSDRSNLDIEEVLTPPSKTLIASKVTQSAYQPVTLLNGTLVPARRSPLAAAMTSPAFVSAAAIASPPAAAVMPDSTAIARPEIMMQK